MSNRQESAARTHMENWAYHTGKLDADGNLIHFDNIADDEEKDKYWHKYMSDSSPYKVKTTLPIHMKSPDRPQTSNKRSRRKKRPRWMTNEEYERLMIKSYVRKQTGAETEQDRLYAAFENGGEPLRWPENMIATQRTHSPVRKQSSRSPSPSPKQNETIQELEGSDRLMGTYRPSSAPNNKPSVAKNLFNQQDPDTSGFFNNLMVTTPNYPLTEHIPVSQRKKAGGGAQHSLRARPTSDNHRKSTTNNRTAQKRGAGTDHQSDAEGAGIVEYGDDTHVIEDEEEAIRRIQTAMLSAAEQSAQAFEGGRGRGTTATTTGGGLNPSPRRMQIENERLRKQQEEENHLKIGDGFTVSGMVVFVHGFMETVE
jgi:hypothetical protein